MSRFAWIALATVACATPAQTVTSSSAPSAASAPAPAPAPAPTPRPGRFPEAVYVAAEGKGAASLLDPARGVARVAFLEDATGEDPRADADGAVKDAGLICTPDELAGTLRSLIQRVGDDDMGAVVCEEGATLTCYARGNHDAPGVSLIFAGPASAPGHLRAIVSLQTASMSELWVTKAVAYEAQALGDLASRRCPVR